MSYARFSKDSDVYVFLSVGGYLDCCVCALEDVTDRKYLSTDAMLAHLREHEAAGHMVPADTFERLEAEREENDAYITAGGER